MIREELKEYVEIKKAYEAIWEKNRKLYRKRILR